MRTLLVDNYDSFTFNLHQLIAEVTGHAPHVLRNDGPEPDPRDWDAVILSPGPGRPERPRDFGLCAQLLEQREVPVLGVCLGMQGIAHREGARIERAPVPMHGRVSRLRHDGRGLFAELPQGLAVVRYHSLCVAQPLPPTLRATAWSEDGVLMALEHLAAPQWGVQFHPESICTEGGAQLLRRFFALARPGVPRAPRPVPTPAAAPAPPRWQVVTRKLRGELPDAERVFHHLCKESPRAFWLDSSRVGEGQGRFSFLGAGSGPHALALRARAQEGFCTLTDARGERREQGGPFEVLQRVLAARACAAPELPFDFAGGWVGYLGYELKAECGARAAHVSSLPDCQLLFADRLIAFDHAAGEVWLVALVPPGEELQAARSLEQLEAKLRAAPPAPPLEEGARRGGSFALARPRAGYLEDLARCAQALRDGESYEVCLTNRLVAQGAVDPLRLHRVLRRVNPAPYAAFLKVEGAVVVSSSPERFLKVDRHGMAEARPIKGTAPRAADEAEDAALAARLRASEKERAENLMIVDLLRNDLARACAVGTVEVPRLMEVESYATVHQLVSTVRGTLAPGKTALDAVRAAFPPGSMTGAPKLRTLELLDALEPSARGVYSGALGYLSATGAADLSVVIRTAVVTPSEVTVGVGGAVTVLSQPEAELEELLLKGKALVGAAGR